MSGIAAAIGRLRRKAFRSVMTMSGIVIGVALVAVVSIIGQAGETAVGEELENMGLGGLSVTASGNARLEESALTAVRSLAEVDSAVPLMLDSTVATRRDGETQELLLCGIDSGETQVIGLTLQYGRLLSRADVAAGARVCIVDTAVAQALYARENIVGTVLIIPVDGVEEAFEVIGVTKAGSTLLQNVVRWIPGMVYIPYTTLGQLSGRTDFDQLAVRLRADVDEEQQARRIERTLASNFGESGFSAENLAAQRDRLAGVMDVVRAVLTAISAISLLVSGLSIMTVMTVAVGERTREIGIKKALGATDRHILGEFLSEAVVLSVGGGVIGVLIGGGCGAIGLALFGMPLTTIPSLAWLIVFAAAVGMLFGVYPAMKAARLDPVEALRCE